MGRHEYIYKTLKLQIEISNFKIIKRGTLNKSNFNLLYPNLIAIPLKIGISVSNKSPYLNKSLIVNLKHLNQKSIFQSEAGF